MYVYTIFLSLFYATHSHSFRHDFSRCCAVLVLSWFSDDSSVKPILLCVFLALLFPITIPLAMALSVMTVCVCLCLILLFCIPFSTSMKTFKLIFTDILNRFSSVLFYSVRFPPYVYSIYAYTCMFCVCRCLRLCAHALFKHFRNVDRAQLAYSCEFECPHRMMISHSVSWNSTLPTTRPFGQCVDSSWRSFYFSVVKLLAQLIPFGKWYLLCVLYKWKQSFHWHDKICDAHTHTHTVAVWWWWSFLVPCHFVFARYTFHIVHAPRFIIH